MGRAFPQHSKVGRISEAPSAIFTSNGTRRYEFPKGSERRFAFPPYAGLPAAVGLVYSSVRQITSPKKPVSFRACCIFVATLLNIFLFFEVPYERRWAIRRNRGGDRRVKNPKSDLVRKIFVPVTK